MKQVFIMACFCFSLIAANGQALSTKTPTQLTSKLEELLPGQQVPDMVLKPMGKPSFQLSSLKGKLVILDFFGQHCTGCIVALPGMQKLQEQFPDKVKVIVVTKDDSSGIKPLLSSFQKLRSVTMPIITNDKVLSGYFYYQTVPTHVWIDTTGKVMEKMDSHYTTIESVRDWLAGKPVHLTRQDQYADYQREVPLFSEGGGRQIKNFRFYSIISAEPDGMDGQQTDMADDRDSATGKLIRILRSPTTIYRLYATAYYEGARSKSFLFDRRRVIYEVKDREKLDFPESTSGWTEWRKNNLYSYEIKVPAEKSDSIYKWMQQDLTRYFGYKASIEKRKVKCWVLRATGPIPKSQENKPGLFDDGDQVTLFTNYRFDMFVDVLGERKALRKQPMINEISGPAKIDLELKCNFEDFAGLKRELLKNHMQLTEEERELDMFVIRED